MINIEEYPYVRYDCEKILEDTNPYSYFKALQERKKFLSAIRQKTTITVNEDYSLYKHLMRRIFDRAEVRGTSYSSKIAPCMRVACEPKRGDITFHPTRFCNGMIQLDRVIFFIRIMQCGIYVSFDKNEFAEFILLSQCDSNLGQFNWLLSDYTLSLREEIIRQYPRRTKPLVKDFKLNLFNGIPIREQMCKILSTYLYLKGRRTLSKKQAIVIKTFYGKPAYDPKLNYRQQPYSL